MIDFITGNVVHIEAQYVVVDVQGMGYRVFVPNPFEFQAKDRTVTIFTHHHVREDAILLFGFSTRAEQSLFRKLIEVSGIGPRVAMGILTGGSPVEIVRAVQQENISYLIKLPGIGKKTAQRMILDLKDKLNDIGIQIPMQESVDFTEHSNEPTGDSNGIHANWLETKSALIALGYTESEVDRIQTNVLNKADESMSVEVMMKHALQLLYGG